MKTTLYHITTFAIILTVAGPCSSCKDNKHEETVCTEANTVKVPQDLKDRFFFREGTYWIYKNLQTNETDSVWVFFSDLSSVSVNEEYYGYIKDKCYETFSVSTSSAKFDTLDRYNRYTATFHPKKGQNLNDELFEITDKTPLNNYDAIYRLACRGNLFENQMGAEITMPDTLIAQDNIIYKDILHLKYPAGMRTYDYLDDMYYAKNIGLVKFHRFTDSSNWELIRSHIIQ